MKKLLLTVAGMALVGCGGGGQEITVSGQTLVVKDQLYTSRPTGFFCNTVPEGQIQIVMNDYSPSCSIDIQPGSPDPRDPAIEHNQLVIIVGGLGEGHAHQNLMNPFTMSKIDCVTNGDNGTAYFRHYNQNQTTVSSEVQVDSGTVKLNQWDSTGAKPTKGTFDLTFGAVKVTGSFDALSCDTSG